MPLVLAVLWLGSGRQVLTKHNRVVGVSVTDELFGDTTVVKEFVPGPIFGYYVGLDLVVAAALLCAAIGLTVWVLARRREHRKEHTCP